MSEEKQRFKMTITFDLKKGEYEPEGDKPMKMVEAVAKALDDLTGYLHISFEPVEKQQ